MVHFDGHGALPQHRPADPGLPRPGQDPAPEAVLVFEGPAGLGVPVPVPVSKVAGVLSAARCRSWS